jgi:hypothetical protein
MNSEDYLFKWYLATRSEEIQWMNRHSLHFRHYVTMVTAILAATLGAIYQFKENAVFVVAAASLGFVVNIVLCIVAVCTCDRAYGRFLEAVTIAAKLEGFLGLDGARLCTRAPAAQEDAGVGDQGNPSPFPGDAYVLPERWIRDRDEHRTAAKFIEAKTHRGVNLLVWITMGVLALLNFGLWVGAVLLGTMPFILLCCRPS